MKGKRWLHAVVVSIVAVFGALAIACGGDDDGKKDNKPFTSPAIGVYYYDAGTTEYLLSLNADKTLALTIDNAAISGKYDVSDSGAVTFSVSGADKLLNTAKYENDEVTLTYDGNVYKFLRNVNYTVTFNTGSGSKIDSATVRNGKKVTKPADPEYANHVFIGWYKDANATNAFKFATDVVRGDLTLYAGWVDKTERDEYQVKFDLGYGDNSLYYTAKTVNGKVYPPEMADPARANYTFKGWWLKDAASGEYATRVDLVSYVFVQNETVYALWQGAAEGGKLDAPIVSVDLAGNRLSWDSVKDASSYSVKVVDPEGKEWKQTVSGTSVEYADKFTKAGTYTVEVYAVSLASADKNSAVTTRKIVNKQLARVSNFKVTGDVLTFGGVENATKYLLYITCDDETHEHNPIDNGSSKEYNFGDCAMPDSGIKFVVEAQADGYVSSRSEEYVVARKLDEVTGFKYDENTQTVSWSAVPNAASYLVSVKCDDPTHEVETEVRNATEIFIGGCAAGSVKVTVVAKNAKKYIPSDSALYAVNKTELAAVTGLELIDTTLTWKKQSRVKKYIVDVNGVTNEVEGDNSVDLSKLANLTWEVGKVYDIKVRAELTGGELTSWSLPFSAAYKTMSELKYSEGVVSWSPVFGIGTAGYKVVVNDAAPVSVSTASYKVTLTDKTNVIKVYIGNADASTAKSISVNAYKLTLDGNGGTDANVRYYAKGDPIALPTSSEVTRRGYNLMGWYTAAEGTGAAYYDGDLYDLDTDLKLFARWDGKEYTIRLNYNIKGNAGDKIVEAKVKFGSLFQLELPTDTKSPLHGFLGWNSAPGGNGESITDELGKPESEWHYTDNNMMLYAQWGEIFSFNKEGSGNNTYYVVRKGVATSQIKEIEIPAEYQAEGDTRTYPVKVVGGNAFQGCFYLVKLTLPSSIEVIEPTALTSLSGLERMDIIGGKPGISRYWSEDGVVFGVNPLTERKQLEIFPRGRTGSYTMPEGIEEIPYEGFKGVSIESLTIPYTVKRVAGTAFASGSDNSGTCKIKEIIFAEPSNPNARVETLNIVDGAFKKMSNLEEISFPSRTFKFIDIDGNESDNIDLKASVFYNCYSLININVDKNNVEYISIDGMLCKKHSNGSDITVVFCPNAHEFVDGKYVTDNRLTIIGTHAFSAVKYLRELEVGISITKIEDGAFSGYKSVLDGDDVIITSCRNLTKVTFKGGRGAKLTIGRAAFGNTTGSMTNLDSKVACTEIDTLVFEDGCNITEIGNYAFAYCSIDTVEFPTSLKRIGYGAFKNNIKLDSVKIAGDESGLEMTNVFGIAEDNVTRSGLFEQCTTLTTVHIPKNVTKLSGSVFLGCKNLTTLTVDPLNPALEFINGILYGKDLETGKINSIHYILPGTDMSNYTLPDGITEINGGIFSNVGDQIKELTINKYVTYVGAEAFKGTGIQKVIFLNKTSDDDDGADTLIMGASVFYNCKSLTEVTLPDRLTVLPAYTFYSTVVLESVELPAGLKEIGTEAFNGSGLLSITIPNTVKQIGYSAFYNCKSLHTVKFAPGGTDPLVMLDNNDDYGIKADGSFAGSANTFKNCGLKEIELPTRLKNIGKYSFSNCISLKSVTIPTSVTVIGTSAFELCAELTTVKFDTRKADGSETLTMENGSSYGYDGSNTTPDSGVFYKCTSLKEISLPIGLDRIPDYAFRGCESLQTVYIPNTVHNTVAGSYDSDTKKAVAPVLAVGSNAFNGCPALKKLDFQDDDPADLLQNGRVFTFNQYAFGTNPLLTEITLPARYGGYRTYLSADSYLEYTGISRAVFKANLQKIFIKSGSPRYSSDVNGIIYNVDGSELVFCPTGKTGKVTIASTVTKIVSGTNSGSTELSSGAFSGCASIDEIEFASPAAGTDVLSLVIGSADDCTVGVFNNCTGLTSITFPERLSAINGYAFKNCTNLKYVAFAGTPTITTIGNSAFYGCTSLLGKNIGTEQEPKYSFVVPKSVTQIGNYAFFADASLTSVTFDGMVFDAQGKVTSDTAGLLEIGISAFEKSGLLSIYLPKSITTMGNGVFANCSKLAKASLPNTVSNLNGTFNNCGKLTELNLYATGADSNFTSENSIIFQNSDGKKILSYYPMSLTKTELTATELAGTTEIADNAFAGNRFIKKITIPNTVTKIGENAFRHCSLLEEVIFEADTVSTEASEGTPAFTGTDSTTLTIVSGNSTKSLFYGCYNLKKVSFPKRLIALGDYTLAYLPKLEEVTFPDDCKLTIFTANAFVESGKEVEKGLIVNIPANVNEFKASVFQNSGIAGSERNADGKAKLVIPASVKTYGSTIFQNATKLTTVEFKTPSSNRANLTLGSTMFSGCTSLSSVTLPNDLVKTGSSSFMGCTSLKEITLGANLTDIAGSTFSGCTNLEKINSTVVGEANIPGKVELIDSSAFLSCGKLTKITLPDSLLGIGNSAFAGMGITEITIPYQVGGTGKTSSYTSIGYLFTNNKAVGDAARIACESLNKIEFADNNIRVKSTSGNAFSNLPNLTSVKLPHNANNFATIGNNGFLNSGITSIDIPKSVSKIEYNTFKGCTDLKTVTFEKDLQGDCALQWVGYSLFENSGLTSITIPKSTKIQATATSYSATLFQGCDKLTTVVFEKDSVITNFVSAATGNSKMFVGCTALTTVRLPENLTTPGVNLFQGCTALENIILPKGVTTIPNYTFDGCSSLKEVKFGNVDMYKPADFATYQSTSAPTSIGNYAFQGAGKKTDENGNVTASLKIVVPPTITSLGTDAFKNSGLNSVTIMSGVTVIPASAFKDCEYLATVTISESVTTIGASAFEGCSALQNVTIPAAVKTIGDKAFYKTSLTSFNVVDTEEDPSQLTTIGANAFSENTALATALVIPATVTTIGASAFYYTGITSVSFGKAGETSVLETIGDYAFRQTPLASVVIPASVTSIGVNPFAYCQKLAQIEVEDGNTMFVGNAAKDTVYSADGTALYIYATGKKPGNGDELEITIGDNVTEIKPWAFFGGFITKLTVGDGVTIGSYAFQSNDLTEVTLGSNVTLKDNAFRYNTILTDVTIGEGAVISYGAFDNCAALEAITIPANSTVDPRAFSNCANLSIENITVSEDTRFDMWGYTAKVGSDGTVTLIVDKANHSFKNNTTITHIEIAEGITSVNADAFNGCTNLVSVKLPGTLTTIGNNAFRGATKLESINFPASLTTVGNYAFYQCPLTDMDVVFEGLVGLGNANQGYAFAETGINSITLPATLNYVGGYTFKNCDNLTAVYFDENGQNVTFAGGTIYYNWFENCSNLETVTLPGNQTTINKQMFDGCSSLKSITIPSTVATIGDNAFRNCTDLAELIFATDDDGNAALTVIPNAFSGSGITSLDGIPASVTEIKASTFKACLDLESVTIPATLKTLGSNVFQDCKSLANVTFETDAAGNSGITEIPAYTFNGTAIKEITIPKTVTKLLKYSFADCASLSKIVFAGYEEGDYALARLEEACLVNTAIETFVVPENVNYMSKPFGGNKLKNLTFTNPAVSPSAIPDLRPCTALEKLTIPEGVTSVNNNLAGLTEIKRLDLPSTITGVGDGTFDGWTAEQKIYFNGLPAPSTSFGKYWRRGCNAKIYWDGEPETPTAA